MYQYRIQQLHVCRTDSKELEGARRSSFSFFIIVSLWYNRDIRIGIWRDDNQSYSTENIILSHKRGVYKYGY